MFVCAKMYVCIYIHYIDECRYVCKYVPFLSSVTPLRDPAGDGRDTDCPKNKREHVRQHIHTYIIVLVYVCMVLTPDTEVSSTANVFNAFCMRS